MAATLDEIDRTLLNLIQGEIPLEARPYRRIARRLERTETEILRRVNRLKNEARVIRQIGAIFDSASLGYKGLLVAAKVDPAKIEEAAAVVSEHPGVSHNYQRNNAYNLWYTLAVPPTSRLGVEGTLKVLHERSGAVATRPMPTIRMYKIGVKLNLSEDADATAATQAKNWKKSDEPLPAITEIDQRMIRVLQQDLPVVERPFDRWAEHAGVSVEELLDAAERYQQQGRMRRFAAVLRHREAGFKANAMGVWVVEEKERDRFAEIAATFQAVSHCYQRPSYEDWPYSLFTMVHGQSEDDCQRVLKAISDATGVTNYGALYSTKEFKKVRVRYFTGEIEAWEHQYAGAHASLAECSA